MKITSKTLALPAATTTQTSTHQSQLKLFKTRNEYRPKPLPYNKPLPMSSLVPKHLSANMKDCETAEATPQGVDMGDLFSDFPDTTVNIQNSACQQVFNNCSVTIVIQKP